MQRRNDAIYYAAVAGDVLGTYLRWKAGKVDERQTALTYSGQFFELCRLLNRPGVASFPNAEKRHLVDPAFSVHSRPFSQYGRGIWFDVYQFCRAVWLFADVMRSRASDVIVMDGVTFFFLLAPLAWSGRRVFLSIHTVLRREGVPQSRMQRVIGRISCLVHQAILRGLPVASPKIAAQLVALTGCPENLISFFHPTYDRCVFERSLPPDPDVEPLRLLYACRIEIEKGVFDLLDSFRALKEANKNVELDYCGDGGALPSLREAIVKAGLSEGVRIHGHLNRPDLLDLLAKAQVVVVPTRRSFPEGLNQVVIEAVLAKRPVVSSSACPAIDLVASAVVEAGPDKVESYTAALRQLFDDRKLFEQKVQAASRLGAEFFFHNENGWTAKAVGMIEGKAVSAQS